MEKQGRLLKVPGQHLRQVELYLLHQGAWYEKPKTGNFIRPFLFRLFDEKHASYIILKYGAVDITEVVINIKDDTEKKEEI